MSEHNYCQNCSTELSGYQKAMSRTKCENCWYK